MSPISRGVAALDLRPAARRALADAPARRLPSAPSRALDGTLLKARRSS